MIARWQNPTRVVFGAGALAELGHECAGRGRRVLVVTDGRVDCAAAATQQLAGLAVSVFAEVAPDPSVATVHAAVDACRAHAADVVVGIGGGSVLDVAKTTAAAVRNPALLDWPERGGFVAPVLERARPALPLVQVPTTAATGSEANALASLVCGGRKRLLFHPLLFAAVALVDPTLTVSLPRRATAEGSVATISRLLVPYLTESQPTPLQDRFVEATLRLVVDATDAALANPCDVAARADLSLAATSSMIGWTTLGRDPVGNPLWYLQNGLTTAAGVSKGAAVAALLPGYLEAVRDGFEPRLGDPSRLAVLDVDACIARWGLPASLTEAGVDAAVLPALVEETLDLWGDVVPWLTRETALLCYAKAWVARTSSSSTTTKMREFCSV